MTRKKLTLDRGKIRTIQDGDFFYDFSWHLDDFLLHPSSWTIGIGRHDNETIPPLYDTVVHLHPDSLPVLVDYLKKDLRFKYRWQLSPYNRPNSYGYAFGNPINFATDLTDVFFHQGQIYFVAAELMSPLRETPKTEVGLSISAKFKTDIIAILTEFLLS